jgi:hypothetical protein
MSRNRAKYILLVMWLLAAVFCAWRITSIRYYISQSYGDVMKAAMGAFSVQLAVMLAALFAKKVKKVEAKPERLEISAMAFLLAAAYLGLHVYYVNLLASGVAQTSPTYRVPQLISDLNSAKDLYGWLIAAVTAYYFT